MPREGHGCGPCPPPPFPALSGSACSHTHSRAHGVLPCATYEQQETSLCLAPPSQAMSGSEALDFLKRSSCLPDVILLDIMMPDMSGYEVRGREVEERFQWSWGAESLDQRILADAGHVGIRGGA
jgi:hypothetical protein